MITMMYHGCEIEAIPEQDPKTHQWLIRLKVSKKKCEIVVSEYFCLTETLPTQKEAINRCWDYGQKIIDDEIKNFSNGNH